jgi:uncharacterized protein YyaL (SSP411 family)
MHAYTNRLARESSPYLLQHAHNPVDWYPWGDEAFAVAKAQDKPVLVSIGYAACHWCHVMERESFEKPEIAAIMNENFINIKVDREERPDVDHIYMDAVQAITGAGGWPLNVFLTPDGKPFYGGTYFPPQRAFNRASWSEVLLTISESYRENKDGIQQQAQQLTDYLVSANAFKASTTELSLFTRENIQKAFEKVMQTADTEWGGFGRAPKFPQTFSINFLIDYSILFRDNAALEQALLSLDKMSQGGIYDHVGGGFARYATDAEWLVPHFEKMLYDNALLVSSLADAYRVTGKPFYKQTIQETLAFVEREMTHPENGFYSALDADSEGEEGKFYVWSDEEVRSELGTKAPLFCQYFDITPKGNWEGKNILWVRTPMQRFAGQQGIEEEELSTIVQAGKEKLLAARAKRPRPLLDDKVLLGWNALMNRAFCKAFGATGDEHYLAVAISNMEFLLSTFRHADGSFYHTWKNGEAKYPAFLDDYASLIAALVELGQVSGDFTYFEKARELTSFTIDNFFDESSDLFNFTSRQQIDVLLRKKEVYDGATPSGNAQMCRNLYLLSIVFNLAEWRSKSEAMMNVLGETAVNYPISFGLWLNLLFEMVMGTTEIAITGPDHHKLLKKVLQVYQPFTFIMAAEKENKNFPLLAGKGEDSKNNIYVCRNYSCQKPVNTVAELKAVLEANNLQIVQ